jgi:hypothetical protein
LISSAFQASPRFGIFSVSLDQCTAQESQDKSSQTPSTWKLSIFEDVLPTKGNPIISDLGFASSSDTHFNPFELDFCEVAPTTSAIVWCSIRSLVPLCLLLAIGLTTCGGVDFAQSTPTILSSSGPSHATALIANTRQSTSAIVANDARNLDVIWAVNGYLGGASAIGLISGDGLHLAPLVVPTPNAVTGSAGSKEPHNSVCGSAAVPIATSPQPIAATFAPTGLPGQVSQTQIFSDTVQNEAQNRSGMRVLSGCASNGSDMLDNVTTTSLTTTSLSDGTPTTRAVAITTAPPPSITVAVSPKLTAVTTSQTQQFGATLTADLQNLGVTWAVDGETGGNREIGTISPSGLYEPGSQFGAHTVTATSVADVSKSGSVTVAVTDLRGVFTYHNNTERTGLNAQEYALSPLTVNARSFGLLFQCALDAPGYVYAQPLYVANLTMSDGKRHNVLFVASESDWVYAFDADSSSCQQLWRTRVLETDERTVQTAETAEPDDLIPEIGVTSTPVIDPTTNTLYLCAKAKDGKGNYHHHLYALDLANGTAKFGSPVEISAPNFVPLYHLQRPGLLLSDHTIYIAFGSHGDNNVYQGWVMGYDATALTQKFVWSSTDVTSGNNKGAIWMAGNGPSADANGHVYLETANGAFNADVGGNDYADSVVKLSSAGSVLDFFTPSEEAMLDANDVELGSSGPIVLPDSVGSTEHPHLLVATGKTGVLYLLDRDNLGRFSPDRNRSVQEVVVDANTTQLHAGIFGQPALFNGSLYVTAVNDPLEQFKIAKGKIAVPAQSKSVHKFDLRGATPAVSANGTRNGIVWAVDVGAYPDGPAILYAYDATDLAVQLYASPASGPGAAGSAVKFTVPTIANGKVYVGGQATISVFGLLPY